MENLLSKINIRVDDCIYLKDPESSSLGKSIIKGSIELICEIGFEIKLFQSDSLCNQSTDRGHRSTIYSINMS